LHSLYQKEEEEEEEEENALFDLNLSCFHLIGFL
jgi:hypothetical protein